MASTRRKFVIGLVIWIAVLGLSAVSAYAQQPNDAERWDELWAKAQELYSNEEWADAADIYIELAEELPENNPRYRNLKNTSYYNAACCYALMGDSENGCVYLAYSIKFDFLNIEHIEQDTDLDSIREEAMYLHLCEVIRNVLRNRNATESRALEPEDLRAEYFGGGSTTEPPADLPPELLPLREDLLRNMERQLDRLRREMTRQIDEKLREFARDNPDLVPPTPSEPQPWLGFTAKPLPESMRALLELPEGEGLLITRVTEGGPGEAAGIQANDILLAVDGLVIGSKTALRALVEAVRVGQALSLEILRAGERVELGLVVGDKNAAEGDSGDNGSNTAPGRAFIGITVNREATADVPGILVLSVEADGPAANAGMIAGDRILNINNATVNTADDLREVLAGATPGQTLSFRVQRTGDDGTTLELTFTVVAGRAG